jgi:lipoprotein-anchoring transpeptidase ErfK/SrfK
MGTSPTQNVTPRTAEEQRSLAPSQPENAPPSPAARIETESTAPASPPAVEVDDAPRITSVAYKTWIWPRPQASGRFLGYIRVGSSVKLKAPQIVPGANCPGGFFAIEPHGYVCNDRTVTRERETPFLEANAHTLPADDAFPYRFALSNGAPMYARLPTPAEQKRERWAYGEAGTFVKMGMFQAGHEHLARTDPITPTHPVPEFLSAGRDAYGREPMALLRRDIPHGSMLAFREAFDVGGRTFLLSTDLTVVPADRVRLFEPSRFHGTPLGPKAGSGGVTLPIAFMREKARPQYALDGDTVSPTGKAWPVRTWVSLTGAEREQGGLTYLEVRDGDRRLFIREEDATVVRDYGKYPFGVKQGEQWMIVSIMEGTLIAYDDLTPVYATLISPGQGGWPRKGGSLVKDSTTPLGTYHMTFKDRAATMSPEFGEDRSFWIADVPFTQYFSPPFALHAAYWHEKFGELMSGGCVNASPIDAAWLFAWSAPHVPEGWQGATGSGSPENGGTTAIVIRR